jgi:hypothetical protein
VSTLKVNNLQVGQDGTAANNYTLYQPASPDGTVRLGYGIAGSVTDILTLKNSRLGIGTDNPTYKLDVLGTGVVTNIKSTNNNYALQFAGNNCAYDVYVGTDNSNNFLLANENNDGTFTERLRIASDGVITINTVPATNNNVPQAVLFQTAAGAIHGGSGLTYNPGQDVLSVNGNIIGSNTFYGAGAGPLTIAVGNYSSTQYIKVSNKIEIKGNVGINEANPTVSVDLSSNTDAVSLPTGTTAQRPSGTDAYIRKNSTNNALEFYNGTNWVEIITDYFPTGSTTLG